MTSTCCFQSDLLVSLEGNALLCSDRERARERTSVLPHHPDISQPAASACRPLSSCVRCYSFLSPDRIPVAVTAPISKRQATKSGPVSFQPLPQLSASCCSRDVYKLRLHVSRVLWNLPPSALLGRKHFSSALPGPSGGPKNYSDMGQTNRKKAQFNFVHTGTPYG